MITVIIDKDSDKNIRAMFIGGHAGYSEEGSDIICSAASTLVCTAVNSLEAIAGIPDYVSSEIKEDTGDGEVNAKIVIPDGLDAEAEKTVQIILRTIETGFITLESAVNTGKKKYIELIESK